MPVTRTCGHHGCHGKYTILNADERAPKDAHVVTVICPHCHQDDGGVMLRDGVDIANAVIAQKTITRF